jgi:hypothetical protein
MNILFDSWSTQVLVQRDPPNYPHRFSPPAWFNTGKRLNTLLGAIQSMGQTTAAWNVYYTDPPITPHQLENTNVYVSLTRYKDSAFAYQQSEISAIQSFVETGGNVLLMTNHGGMPDAKSDDWTVNDKAIAALFGVTLEDYFVTTDDMMTMPIGYSPLSNNVSYMCAHDSCLIVPPSGGASITTIAEFPSNATAYNPVTRKRAPPSFPYFAVLVPYNPLVAGVPYNQLGAGSLLLIGNSGWVGDESSQWPAPGLIAYNNNLQFALNCLALMGAPRVGKRIRFSPSRQPCRLRIRHGSLFWSGSIRKMARAGLLYSNS